jgi:hypothetical protein
VRVCCEGRSGGVFGVRDLFGDDLTPNVACKAAQQTTEAVIVKVESPDV